MKKLVSFLVVSTALALPGLAAARPVTLTTTLNDSGGDGACLAPYLTDANGAYVRTLWVSGEKSKYYKHLTNWHRATGAYRGQRNGMPDGNLKQFSLRDQAAVTLAEHPQAIKDKGAHHENIPADCHSDRADRLWRRAG
jgi:hypothetical protein